MMKAYSILTVEQQPEAFVSSFVLRGNREMTEKYEYCSTIQRTFIQDCTYEPFFEAKLQDIRRNGTPKCWQLVRRPIGCLAFFAYQLSTLMTSELASYSTCHQFAATSLTARRCGLLKLLILSLTSKEFSGAQQNSFCLCRIGLTLVISRDF